MEQICYRVTMCSLSSLARHCHRCKLRLRGKKAGIAWYGIRQAKCIEWVLTRRFVVHCRLNLTQDALPAMCDALNQPWAALRVKYLHPLVLLRLDLWSGSLKTDQAWPKHWDHATTASLQWFGYALSWPVDFSINQIVLVLCALTLALPLWIGSLTNKINEWQLVKITWKKNWHSNIKKKIIYIPALKKSVISSLALFVQ